MSPKNTRRPTIPVFALLGLFALLLPGRGTAVPAAPGLYHLMQPDGEPITVRQWGDEHAHGFETTTGRAVAKDPVTRQWNYAVLGWNGQLTSSGVRVANGRDRTAVERGFSSHLRPAPETQVSALARAVGGAPARFQTSAESAPLAIAPLSTANVPVILINFTNTATTNTPANFASLLFGAGTWSMSDYYTEVSYGKFSVAAGPSGVGGWYRASNTHDYYGANSAGSDAWPGDLVYEAAAAADAAGYNFAAYDKDGDCKVDVVAVVHQGTGEEASSNAADIWSHRWSLSSAQAWGRSHHGRYTTRSDCPAGGKVTVDDYIVQPERLWGGMTTMGVFAHEYGHSLGLPDLYDTDGSSEGDGNWSLMAGGAWGQASVAGDRPSHMDPWSKYKLGWVTPTQVTGTLTNEPIDAANAAADVYQLRSGGPASGGEYFLVENRQRAGFDAGLPGAGLLIWHIDEAKATASNQDNAYECYPGGISCASQHYHVAVVQADNLWNLEKNNNRGDGGDPFPGTGNKTTFDASSLPASDLYAATASGVQVTAISAPASTMTATLSNSGGGRPDFAITGITLSPTTPAINGSFSATVTVVNQGTGSGNGGRLSLWTSQSTVQTCGATGDQSIAVGTLNAGASTLITVSGLTAGATGAKTLRAFVDSACAATESSETNNQFTKSYTPGLPDFAVTAVVITPTIPTANGGYTAAVTVANRGVSPGDGGNLTVWANQATVPACGASGDQTTAVGTLNAGQSITLTLAGLPAGVAGGKTFRAFVDQACANNESTETNNQYTKAYTVGQPDFTVSSVTLSPTSPAPYGAYTATIVVRNAGNALGDGGTLAAWSNQAAAQPCSASADQSTAIGPLGPAQSATYTLSLVAGPAGAKSLRVATDNDCATPESNESNNQYLKAYTTTFADFTVTGIVLSPLAPAQNRTFRAAVTVKNQGVATDNAGTLTVWTHLATAPVCGVAGDQSLALGNMASGEVKTLILSGLPSGTSGSKTFRASVDNACATTESVETNNQRTQTYTVPAAPELVITGITLVPATPTAGGTFSAQVTLQNQGTANSAAHWLELWSDQPNPRPCFSLGDGQTAIAILAPGASATYTVNNLPAGTSGGKTLRAYVDSYCEVPESNEDNNQSTLGYTVP